MRFPTRTSLILALVLGATPAHALWTSNGVPVGGPAYDGPEMVGDGAGGVLIGWLDLSALGNEGVWVQRLEANGAKSPAWPADGVRALARNDAFDSMAPDGLGGAFVTASSHSMGSSPGQIGLVLASGVPAPSWNPNACAQCRGSLRAASDGAGGAFVTWWSEASPSGPFAIQAGRLSPTGEFSWSLVLDSNAGFFSFPAIVATGAGPTIAWAPSAARLDASGDDGWLATLCDCHGIETAQIDDGTGGVIVVWSDAGDIYAQRVTGGGSIAHGWNPGGVAVAVRPATQSHPALCPDGAGGAWITWQDDTGEVRASRVTGTGAHYGTTGTDGILVCTTGSTSLPPAITADGDGGAYVVWEDTRAAGVHHVFAQHLSPDGVVTPGWAPGGSAVCTHPAGQGAPVSAPDGSGGVVLAWRDARAPGVYAQRIAAGDLIALGVPDAPRTPSGLALTRVRPNPCRGRLQLDVTLPESGEVRLRLMDISGRCALDRRLGGLGAGTHVVALDLPRLRQGLYLARAEQGAGFATAKVVIVDQ